MPIRNLDEINRLLSKADGELVRLNVRREELLGRLAERPGLSQATISEKCLGQGRLELPNGRFQ